MGNPTNGLNFIIVMAISFVKPFFKDYFKYIFAQKIISRTNSPSHQVFRIEGILLIEIRLLILYSLPGMLLVSEYI